MVTRYVIVGPDGYGKSTLARAISPHTPVPSMVLMGWLWTVLQSHGGLWHLAATYLRDDQLNLLGAFEDRMKGLGADMIYAKRRQNRPEWELLVRLYKALRGDEMAVIQRCYDVQAAYSVQVFEGFRETAELYLAREIYQPIVIELLGESGQRMWPRAQVDYCYSRDIKPRLWIAEHALEYIT